MAISKNKDLRSYLFFKELKHLPYVDRIYLFGSRAAGRNQKLSDIDLAIECPRASNQQWNELLEIIENADTLLEIDCVRYDQIRDDNFKNSILNNHMLLFDKGNKK